MNNEMNQEIAINVTPAIADFINKLQNLEMTPSSEKGILQKQREQREKAAMEMCDLIVSRTRELEATAEATEAAITAENWNDPQTKAAVEDLADAVEDLRTSGKKLVKAVVEETEAKRVLTAIDSRLWSYSSKADPASAYGKLSAALKRVKEKVAGFKDAAHPKEPSRAWVVRMDMNGDQFTAMAKAAEKAGCPFQVFATPQSDKATKQITKWFEENV